MRQDCLLSPFLLLLAIDWIITSVTNQKKLDPDFADNLAALSHNHQEMQEKTSDLHYALVPVGMKLNEKKTEILRINACTKEPVTLGRNWRKLSLLPIWGL